MSSSKPNETAAYTGRPRVLAAQMRLLQRLKNDKEFAHTRADDELVRELRRLGYGEAMDIYEDIERWFA